MDVVLLDEIAKVISNQLDIKSTDVKIVGYVNDLKIYGKSSYVYKNEELTTLISQHQIFLNDEICKEYLYSGIIEGEYSLGKYFSRICGLETQEYYDLKTHIQVLQSEELSEIMFEHPNAKIILSQNGDEYAKLLTDNFDTLINTVTRIACTKYGLDFLTNHPKLLSLAQSNENCIRKAVCQRLGLDLSSYKTLDSLVTSETVRNRIINYENLSKLCFGSPLVYSNPSTTTTLINNQGFATLVCNTPHMLSGIVKAPPASRRIFEKHSYITSLFSVIKNTLSNADYFTKNIDHWTSERDKSSYTDVYYNSNYAYGNTSVVTVEDNSISLINQFGYSSSYTTIIKNIDNTEIKTASELLANQSLIAIGGFKIISYSKTKYAVYTAI